MVFEHPLTAHAASSDVDEVAGALERSMRRLVDAALAASEEIEERVAPPHLRALQSLETLGPSHVSALADTLAMLPSTVSRLSDRLAAAGFITRAASASNRRATVLELTPAGREVLADLVRARVARLREVLAAMTVEDREALVRGTTAFGEAVDRGPEERSSG